MEEGSPADPMNLLERRLGWVFKNKALLRRALTHSTYANENPEEGSDYERLEFLGDAVLDLVAAHLLFEQLPLAAEGELSRRRARVVRRETLATLAERLDLGHCVFLGKGQRLGGGKTSKRILADCFEAVAGAVYLDGGYEAASRCFAPHVAAGIEQTNEPLDFKTRLQEACHRLGKAAPDYRVSQIDGAEHERLFTCEVVVDGVVFGHGTASNKKAAEQICARLAMGQLDPDRKSP